MMAAVQSIASFARWRLVPVRYATRLLALRPSRIRRRKPMQLDASRAVQEIGITPAAPMSEDVLGDAQKLYRSRIRNAKPSLGGHPFVNLIEREDISATNPIMRQAFSPEVLDVAIDYFGGACTLDSLQVLWTWPSNGPPTESQLWHLDYADTKSLHYVAYLNDVVGVVDGPFVCVDRAATRKVGRSIIIRRIPDDLFAKESEQAEILSFTGRAGEGVLVDPAACYHYGSRCQNPDGRLAVFVTFSSTLPFVPAQPFVVENRDRLLEVATQLRPDLPQSVLRDLFLF